MQQGTFACTILVHFVRLLFSSQSLQRIAKMKEEPAIDNARFVGGDAVAHEVDSGSWVVVGSLNDEAEMDLRESVVRFNFQNLPKDSNSNHD